MLVPLHGSRRLVALATLGLLLAAGAGVALAQKPSTVPPQPPLPQVTPPGIQPLPRQPAPLPPRTGVPDAGQHPGKPPAQGQAPVQPQRPPAVAAPPAAPGGKPRVAPPAPPPVARPAPQPIPPNEPPPVTALRQMLPPGTQLSYAAAEVMDPASGRTRLTGVVMTDASGRTTAEELVFEGVGPQGAQALSIRNLVLTTNERPAVRITLAALDLRGLVIRQPFGMGMPDPSMVDLDVLRLEGFRLDAEVHAAIGTLEIAGWGGGRPTRIAATGLEIGGPPQRAPFDRMAIGRFAMAGLDLQAMAAAVVQSTPPPMVPGDQLFEMADIAFTMRGAPVASVAAVTAASRTDAAGSGTGRMAIRGVRIGAAAGIGDWLRRFGYDEIRAELSADSTYDAPTGRMEITDFRLAGQDVGALTLSLLFDGLTPEAAMRNEYRALRFLGGRLVWLDQSILARFLRDQARQQGGSEAALREQFAALAGGVLGQPGAAMASVREAVLRYIRGQASEIEIVARPPAPITADTMDRLGAPGPAMDALGLSATAR
ncbi:MAG TPA: hypothetical protein VD970_19100 [Acetobacteraceae bacterium]|nr:hypothetical protein [Acetobacteraceae bacterium]